MIAKVEPLTTARALRGPFDYRVPAHIDGVGVGTVLVVPFGRRQIVGVVTDLAETSAVAPERLVEPLAALEPSVPPELMALGLRVAREYCSTPARGLALVLPPGTGTGASRRARTRRVLRAALTEGGYDALAASPPLGARQRAALEALASGARTVAELKGSTACGHASLRSLEARGLVELYTVESPRRPGIVPVGAAGAGVAALTEAQAAALASTVALMDAPAGDRRVLLHGVTGSGKTEVYLGAAAAAIERGRTAIVLVPEIALAPQTAARFERRFGDAVAILHSGLSQGERYDEWMRLRKGQARICVGPRSAVFAPVEDLGLIVVDEEHDASYKQEGDPRYDARRVAELRAAQSGAVVLHGSATPRPESWLGLRRLRMPERIDGRPLPPVELLGMEGVSGALHPRSREALEEIRRDGGKAIVLLNRRGWSNFLTCRGCARVWACSHCDVTLVLHREAATLRCHHCGLAQPVPSSCPDCGSVSLARHGAGTERIEEELRALLAPLPIVRLDSDSGAAREASARLLARFDAAPAGALVGTQMVAKGHDFPDVTLGLVLDADATLRFPDFRAEERTFSLVAQLAGRIGRGPSGGRVLVQALDPKVSALGHASRHDAEAFLSEEIARRKALCYPPFADLIRVVCSTTTAGPELDAATAVKRSCATELAEADAIVMGPAPLFRRRGQERSQVVLKARDRAPAVRAVRQAVESAASARAHRGVAFSVDVDPQ